MLTPPRTPPPPDEIPKNTSILITGGTGFLGTFIVAAILEHHPDWAITVLDLNLPVSSNSEVVYQVADITDPGSVDAVVNKARPDAIIHSAGIVPELAGRYGRKLKETVFNVNVTGTQNMLAAAKSAGVDAFVWTGSCTAVTDDMRYQYPNIDERWPTSSHSLIYGESKVGLASLRRATSVF